jgi:radical SAM protein with 4Fe4S-binding SPASM domain
MSEETFSRIARDLFPSASVVDLRGWGESTILKNFDERVARTIEAGPRVRLVTNALVLKPSTWELLMQAAAMVVVSVDAATTATFSALGRGSLAKVIASIATGAKARDASASGGKIFFNTTLSSLSLPELPGVVTLAAQHGVTRITLFPIGTTRNDPLHLCHSREILPTALHAAAAMAGELGIELRFGVSLTEDLVVSEALPDLCSHPWSYCYIDYAGRVGYCDHLVGHPEFTLGNLMGAQFDAIWNGSAFQSLRDAHVRARESAGASLGNGFGHCTWCYSRRYVDFEDETHPSAINSVVSTTHSLPIIRESVSHCHPSDFLQKEGRTHVQLL